ncbi:MAG: universal stress protein, partial [bacterium]|nr:universal stress protein [bacterium]
REAREYLLRIQADLAEREPQTSVEVLHGHPAERVLERAREFDVDLIALGTHGESGVTSWDFGSTADKIVARAGTSVLVVPSRVVTHDDPVVPGRRILVPLDGSPRAEYCLPTALGLAAAVGGEVGLAHFVGVPRVFHTALPSEHDRELRDGFVRRNEELARHYLATLASRIEGEGVRARTWIGRAHNPHVALVELVDREGYDLVVLSAHGQTTATDQPYGLITRYLIAHRRRPVLVVQDLSNGEHRGLRPPHPARAEGSRLGGLLFDPES